MVISMKVGVAQMCSGVSIKENLARIAQFASQASARGVRYLLTPEMSIVFEENAAQLAKVALGFENNPALTACADIARENSLFLHIGSLAIALEGGRFANTSVLFNPHGEIVDQYDKIHLFDAEIAGDEAYRESDNYVAGKQAVVTQADDIKIGMSICYDVRFGELYRQLAKAGAQIICVPAAFTVPTGKAHWEILLRARAIETGCYILTAAQGGSHQNGRETFGHSMIIDPWGEIISIRADQTEGLIFAELDFDRVKQARRSIPSLSNEAEFCLTVNHD